MFIRLIILLPLVFMTPMASASYSAPGALFGFDGFLCLEKNANFRVGPDRLSRVLRVVPRGERYYADAMTGDGNWFRMVIDNQVGYFHRSVLRADDC